jgi:stage V sporulation protein K
MSGQSSANHPQHTVKKRQIQVIIHHNEPKKATEQPQVEGKTEEQGLLQKSPISGILRELEQMIGLDHVKMLVHEIYALLEITKIRTEAGLHTGSQVYHMIFKGNPGTGKTTVARIIAKLFKEMGVLGKGHFIEAERADLVGEYIGHTALKTRELIKKSMGGILFIDEAYSLARGGEKDFGKEAIDTLVKGMEDYKNQFILILAGYPDEMERFLDTNPGLPSRFPMQVDFPDYSVDELIQIAESMVKERDYSMLPDTVMKLKQQMLHEKNKSYTFSNARYVRNQIEKATRVQAVRLLSRQTGKPSRQELMALRPEDFQFDKT